MMMKPPGPFKSIERFRPFEEPPQEGEVFGGGSGLACEAPGGFIDFASNRRLMMAHMAPARLLWEIERPQAVWPDRHPRPIQAWAGSRLIDPVGGRIFEVCERKGDAAVEARDLMTGRLLWSVDVASPAPAWPKRDRGKEVIDAILAPAPSGVALLLNRKPQRAELDERGRPVPAPSQVDVQVLNSATGRAIQSFSLPDVHLDLLEQEDFDGLHRRGNTICDLDWRDGRSRVLAETPAEPSRPARLGNRIAVAWRRRGEVGVTLVEPGGNVKSRAMRLSGVKRVDVFPAGDVALLQLNWQRVMLLESDLSARWEARVKPGVWATWSDSRRPIWIATGGSVTALDARSGTALVDERPVHQGCHELLFVDGADWLVTSFNTTRRYGFGIALVRPDGSEFQAVDVPCLVATWQRRVATSLDDDGMMSVYSL